MKRITEKRSLRFFTVLIVGLFTTQIIATVHIYLSNIALFQSMKLVQKAGYLPVPNEHLWKALQDIWTALWGGLFFTLSIGAGLSITTLFFAWIWDQFFKQRKWVLSIYFILWLICIMAVNGNGFSFLVTAYFIIVPLIVFLSATFLMPFRKEEATEVHRLVYLGVPILLILLFLPLAHKSIFLDIRDKILLNNAVGRKINAFYYDYNLYAAEAFKSLEQKTIRTCKLSLTGNESYRNTIKNIFLSHDYLPITNESPVDLLLVEQDGRLAFIHREKTVITSMPGEFEANPTFIFQQFSEKTDSFRILRLLTFFSLTIMAPLCLYIILQGILYLFFVIFMDQKRAAYVSLLLSLLLGIAVALPLYSIKTLDIDTKNFSKAMESENWFERVVALRFIEKREKVDGLILTENQDSLKSPYIAERYWYVRTLGSIKSPETVRILLEALDDPSTNVVCMAFYSLGRLKNKAAISKIINRMGKSNKWYEQWYGYRALRVLGWKQAPR